MNNIAIIPARSGSKGVRDKNIRDLCGKPLMAHTIEAALGSGEFEEVMVSTDSERYAEIARKYGAKVPFLRSAKTSCDSAGSWDMVDEVLGCYAALGKSFDTFCLLQPTSPLRTGEDIQAAYDLFRAKAAFAVVSVCKAEHSPLWCGQLPEDGELANFLQKENIKQRQALGKFYRPNGAIYIADTKFFREERFLYQKGCYAFIMNQEHSIDIDTELDFKIAGFLSSMLTKKEC